MRAVLALFDIDGTLLAPRGLGRRSLERAFEQRYRRRGVFDGVEFHGRTDPEIFAEGLQRLGRPASEYPEMLDRYLGHLEAEVAGGPALALPGIVDLVEALASTAGVVLGLVTGNVRRGASIKLARDGLARRFPIGAFGDDSTDRGELVRLARGRAEAAGFGPFRDEHCFHVGDTLNDIQAARAAGIRAVAVATGGHDRATLEAARPDRLYDVLPGPGRFLAEVLA